MRTVWLLIATLALAAGMTACGGGDGSDKNQGAAMAAVAEFFVQERDGGLLPEGIGVKSIGVQTSDVHPLDVRSQDKDRSVDERYCMEYRYQDPSAGFREHRRVYVAELVKGAWSVTTAKPDGTCEGVD